MTAAEKIIRDCVSPFNTTQRQRLKDLSKVPPRGTEYPAHRNAALDAYIEQLKEFYPEMFQTNESLKHRTFIDEPTALHVPFGRFVRSVFESPYRLPK